MNWTTRPAEQWLQPSLCDGWRACDVFGHMAYGGSTPLLKVLPVLLVKYRGNLDRGSKMDIGTLIKPRDQVLDHPVHALDIRRTLGG